MIKEVQAKTLLSSSSHSDPLSGIKYTMNLYRGCQHQCIYCDSRSKCYQIENFSDVLFKVNAIDLLRKELPAKRMRGTISTGSMNDPYMPLEARYRMTRRALAVIAKYGFPVHIITKGTLVVRDIPLLQQLSRIYSAVSFTITTSDDRLARIIEPGAPASSKRFAAMRMLASAGIYTGVTLMPVLPYIENTPANIEAVVQRACDAGASYMLPWFGMSMREGQRSYFYTKLNQHFPGLRRRYEERCGERYECADDNASAFTGLFNNLCARYGISTRMPIFTPVAVSHTHQARHGQIGLFQ